MCNTVSLLAVTNRHLSVHPYPEQIARICQTHPKGLILREKDLEAESYLALAAQVLDICHKYDVPCILHTFWKEAIALGCTSIHLPLPLLRRLSEKGILSSPEFASFTVLGTSVHSVAEAREAEHLGVTYLTAGHLLTMAVSVLLAWLITDGLFGVLIPYTSTDWLQTLCLLFVAFVVTFFFFDQDKNIVTRSENEEISLSLRFNIAFGLVYAGCMLLAKATMLDSRYFAVTVPAVNAVLLPFSHAILKRLLIRFQRSWGMETLVGVVTTSDRAERLISEIRKDWSRRVVGVSLLEATPAAVSTRVCGVEVKATFDDFMDWIRREALDEVYVDVPMDSGESFIPYLDEMESMGLTVHFRLPLLDRIEEACCDETSAARLSRSLGRCAS